MRNKSTDIVVAEISSAMTRSDEEQATSLMDETVSTMSDYGDFGTQKSTFIGRLTKLVGATFLVGLLFVALMDFKQYMPDALSGTGMASARTAFDTTAGATFTVEVESPGYDQLVSLSMVPWDVVAEPNRDQYISITSLTVDGQTINVDDGSYSVVWQLGDVSATGNSATFQMTGTGVFDCTVKATSASGMTYEYDFTMAVKYIRREIRALSDDDRTAFFDALYKIYTVDSHTGKSTYGSKFNTAEYFVYKHLNGAGTTDCDHWHDGAGIVTHHIAFTLEVEQALQAIDPSVAMPYWEYGMDPYLYTNWWESPFFNSDWFGEANPLNDEHIIDDGGMWVGIQVPDGSPYEDWSIADTGSLNPFVNGFGHMRTPWNNNPIKGIGRHNMTYGASQYNTMPVCSTLQNCFQSTTFADINDCLNGATHGPVHILIGGSWGDGTLFDDPDISFLAMPDKLLFFKVLWRMGWTRCPSTCTLGKPCSCSVPQEYIDEYGAYYILEITNVVYGLAKYLTNADDAMYMKVLRAVEDPGIAGEMFSSAAAYDPTFWPLHGAAERMVGLKRIMISQGDITNFDETWEYTSYNKASGAAYLNGVCDWSKVAGGADLTLPECTLDVICFGHNANDLMEFSGFLSDSDAYTNTEFWDFIHPWNDDLPYLYDTYDYDYCDEQGYSFTAEVTLDPMDPSVGGGDLPSDPSDPSVGGDVTGDMPTDPSIGGDMVDPSVGGDMPSDIPMSPNGDNSGGKSGMGPPGKMASSKQSSKQSSKDSSEAVSASENGAVRGQGSPKKARSSSGITYKGWAEGKTAPPKSTRTAPKEINTMSVAERQALSESMAKKEGKPLTTPRSSSNSASSTSSASESATNTNLRTHGSPM